MGICSLHLTPYLFSAVLEMLNATALSLPYSLLPIPVCARLLQTRSRAEVKAPGIIPRKSVHEPVQVRQGFSRIDFSVLSLSFVM